MKKYSLVAIAVLLVAALAGCANEDAVTGAKTETKAMGQAVMSETKQPASQASVSTPPVVTITGNSVLLADFNSGSKPSNIGGDFGAWDKDPADFSQGCRDSFDPVNRYGTTGFGMKLDYDVDSANPAYNGFWMKLRGFDARPFKSITFLVKGDADAGHTTVFKIELKNAKGEVGKFYVTNVSSDWQEVVVPFSDFHGIGSFDSLTEFVIVFEDYMTTNKDGIVYIDDIKVTK